MEVKKYVKSTIENLIWTDVAQIMDHSAVPSSMWEELDELLASHGLTREQVVPMATHSWGGRRWRLRDGASKPLFFEEFEEEGRREGWHLLREEEVTYIYCASASSGSTLEAEKRGATWEVSLEVPIQEDGTPYHGVYAKAFERVALRLDSDDERWEALAEEYESSHGEFAWMDHEPEDIIALPEGLDGPWGWEVIASAAGYNAWRRPVNAQV